MDSLRNFFLCLFSLITVSYGRDIVYYVAIDEIDWTYKHTDQSESIFRKAVFREYKDQTFTTRKPVTSQHGLLGPVIRATSGDTLRIQLKNNAKRPYSFYTDNLNTKRNESGAASVGSLVPPGSTLTYVYTVTDANVPPASSIEQCMTSLYYSDVNLIKDTNTGLVGMIVICKSGVLVSPILDTDIDSTSGNSLLSKMAGNTNQENLAVQTAEINEIKAEFKGSCRLLKDLGEFTHVLTLQPSGQDIVYKFQMTGSYPQTKPNIIIRCPVLSEEEIADLVKSMETDIVGEPMIQTMLNKAEQHITVNKINVNSKPTTGKGHYENKGQKNKDKRRKRKEKQEEEEVKDEKKTSMKTADDVIKRIQWDADLPQDEFIVGYIDRFLGIQEKYFTSFSWEDIASVDYSVLAVPKHRIEYFKYKDIKVWDKPRRIDNVFGSTGSKKTIYDVIAEYERLKIDTSEKSENKTGDDDSDDDSDDDICVTIDGTSATNFQTNDDSDEETASAGFDEEMCDDTFDKYWRNKLRPNYFLAFRVTDPDILQTTEGIQDVIMDHEPRFESCCLPLHCLHVTLCTLGLDTPEQVAHCVEVLNKLKPELAYMAPKDTPLVFKGMDQFFNRVVYAKVKCSKEMYTFVEHLKLCLKNEGIEIRDNHDFVPHMTIVKVTRTVGNATGKKYIPPWVYSNKLDVDFGKQVFDNIFLCQMSHERRKDGFYASPMSLSF